MGEPNRREALQLVGLGAVGGLATAAGFGGCGDNLAPGAVGAALLEPSPTAVIASVFAPGIRTATVAITRDGGDAPALASFELAESGAGAADVAGLSPATDYTIEITLTDGTQLGPHRVRTAPEDDDPRAIRLAVIADVDPNPEFATDLIDHVVRARPDALVSIGDFPYTDNGPIAETVDAYRARHVEVRALPRFRALLEAAPMYAIYDDHEFRNNWDAMFAATESSRYAAAMQVWDEFFPLRAATGDVRYRSWRYGANVECFLLDCRRFRSANAAADDATKTMLGEVQRDWLLAGLAASTAAFKLVFTSVPLDFGNGDDHWSGFRTERAALLDGCLDIPGILFVSADQHWLAAHRHVHGIRELQIGPLARGIATPAVDAPGVLFRATDYNVGLLDITPDRLTMTGLGPGGVELYTETLAPADLTPRRSRS